MNIDYQDIAVRSFKTFGQVFVLTLLATNEPMSEKAIFAAAAAGISAVWNMVLVPVYRKIRG